MSVASESHAAKLVAEAQAWASQDPETQTKLALEQLVDQRNLVELASCMTPLAFGTAGLRGLEGPGPGRMNVAVVLRTAAGLAQDLLEKAGAIQPPTVVLGYDARRNSQRYSEKFVGVLVAAGIRVSYFEEPVPTPLVAYAARRMGATAAVCITASHNPAQYAGLKVYADNAVQIVAPRDAEIAAAIAAQGPADAIPCYSLAQIEASPLSQALAEDTFEQYFAEVLAARATGRSSRISIVYTPLHGVGGRFMTELLARAGYPDVHPVREQYAPDPDFSTLRFPNPEEPGTLNLALSLARDARADLVLANDPDADRLAVAVVDGGGYRVLTGNQVGLLLVDYLLEHETSQRPHFVVSSIVSSPMLEAVARHHGAAVYRTLTGFKWMLNAALAIEREQGAHFVFGFEEALGYAIRGPVLDKDGLSAGLLFADLMAEAKRGGHDISSLLSELYARHGLWASSPRSVSLRDDAALEAAKVRLAELAREPPTVVGGIELDTVVDYTTGVSARPWYLGYADMLEFRLRGGSRVIVRPSGTEPKLKIYADFVAAYAVGLPLDQQERAAEQCAEQLAQSLADLLNGV